MASATTYVMLIWLAMGAVDVRSFHTYAQCRQQLDQLRRDYGRAYVVKESGCFPLSALKTPARKP